MIDVPFAYALTVGMVATVNPCGFPMLPAYVSWFVGVDEDARPGAARIPRALTAGLAVSAGFLLVAGALGVPVHAGLTELYRVMPWLTILIGAGLAAMGVALLLGHRPGLALPRLDRGGRSRGIGSMVAFGASYAVASLGCTLPLFLSVVAGRPNATSGALTVLGFEGAELALAAGVVTLATHVFNLLDLRPGRSTKALVVLVLCLTLGSQTLEPFTTLGLVLGPILVLLVPDLRERAMLGDTGAGAVGAVGGVWLVLTLPALGQAVALGLLAGIALYGELRSISVLVERKPLLSKLDSLGRIHA